MNKLEIKDLNLFYKEFKALKNINMDIEENSVTAFIGPSGCGKSSLLKTINRMNDLIDGCKVEGEIKLDNINIYEDIDAILLRKKVGMVFQKPNPFPMSIYDNVAYGLRVGGIKDKLIAAIKDGIKIVYLPIDNKADVLLIDDDIIKKLNIKYVENYKEIFEDIFHI